MTTAATAFYHLCPMCLHACPHATSCCCCGQPPLLGKRCRHWPQRIIGARRAVVPAEVKARLFADPEAL